MQIQEQIYTSAIKLLDPGQSDLGVVAESIGFPRKVATNLGSLASYRLLDKLPGDSPSLHPARIVAMSQESGKYYSVSRIVFAGADHTGRTTPLAHHVLFSNEELLVGDGAKNFAAVLSLQSHFVNRWEELPKRFDPPRSLNVVDSNISIPQIGNASSLHLAGILGWLAACSADWMDQSKPPVVFILPDDQRDAALRLLASIFITIPAAKQNLLVFQSHVVSSNDLVGAPSIVATYPNNEYLTEIHRRPDKRRPKIFDLTDPTARPLVNVGFASWFEKQLDGNATAAILQSGLTLHESLRDIDEKVYPDGFSQLFSCTDDLESHGVLNNVSGIGKRLRSLSAMSPSAERFVVERTSGFISDHFKNYQTKSDWAGLLNVIVDTSWPEPVRKLCWKAIVTMPENSFPSVLANKEAMKMPSIIGQLDEFIDKKPALWAKLLQASQQQAFRCREFLESRIVPGRLSLQGKKQLIELLLKTSEPEQRLHVARLYLALPNQSQLMLVQSFEWLQSIVPQEAWLQDLHAHGNLPMSVANVLQAYLRPPVQEISVVQDDQIIMYEPEQNQRVTEANFPSKKPSVKSRKVADPSPLIKKTAIVAVVATLLGSVALFSFKLKTIQIPWLPSLKIAIIFGIASLVIGLISFLSFHANKKIGLQKPLMISGFFSAFLMAVSSVIILSSVATSFFIGGAK